MGAPVFVWLAIRGNLEVMELLPDNWADVNAVENECWTALVDFVWGGNRTWSVCFLGERSNADAKTAGAKAR